MRLFSADKICVCLLLLLAGTVPAAQAAWVWTPESGKWVNPKNAVKETPQEQLAYARELYESGEREDAAEEFKRLLKHYPKSREAADAQFFLGRLAEDEGQLMRAFRAYQEVIETYPFSERAGDVIEQQYIIGKRLFDGEGRRNKLIHVVTGGDYNVVEVFRTVIKNAPYGPYAAPAQYKIGLYLQEKGMFQEARDEFEKLINDYPDSKWTRAAKYQIAVSDAKRSSDPEYDQRVTEAAIEQFEEFLKEYPDAELSAGAKEQIQALKEKEAENAFVVAKFYEKHKKYKAARIYYNTIVEDYRATSWAPKALNRIRALSGVEP